MFKMKGTSLVVSVFLFIAIAVLYVLQFTGGGKKIQTEVAQTKQSITGGLKIAYVKTDSLILNYDLAQDLHDEFTKKQEAYTNEYTGKRTSFEKDAADFQEKVNRGGFLTEQRAIQERDRLVSRQQEIEKLDQELSSKLAELQTANNKQLLDSVINYLNMLNKTRNYDYILNAADILIGDETSNITNEVLTGMNEKYSKSKLGK
jgi:outer membrane protein